MKYARTSRFSQLGAAFALLLLLGACVTVNIYFPAAEVEKAAENIVNDVYKEGEQQNPDDSSSLEVLLAWFAPSVAHAADASTVSNAAIRNLKQRITGNHSKLAPFYKKGNVGIDNQGFLVLRNKDGLNIQQVAQLKRLINTDNQLRRQLYQEVAKALGIKQGQVGKVQDIFAREWQSKAPAGYWIQSGNGSWKQK